ncbi:MULTISPECIES: 16S rRNA (guanine(966)-N(2))-methyltransferase RsmD [Lysinibacillus]|uniref:16S rRNA (Guanine(966)-N(2))-methyltransferase RsmD n=1 Tax=Lysinibacillus antri TaxID=2498145 RepID=A0A432LGW6_9BACI|nr:MULTISPECIES: 16S rRNA (guanine(966)-N(2))-methyltransferase RsmD [Lysinibacillus]RUL55925.1 16S rRNA (guanine(966)-N(2))-methyltransferase RsmD [Lysinibacillus antri]TSI09330.1 16S rRNA (guanine(966)-N(2))-methyltransferase RsmD [Lysinibacillus sp. BW-2-10]
MRVVAGERKGMPLKAVSGTTTRPTTDKVKESIFNMIGPFFDGGVVLDLFAGSGGLGIETLSRGAHKGIFVEKDPKAYQTLLENIKKCRYEDIVETYRTDANRAVKGLLKRDIQIDYVFMDPPYLKKEYYDLVETLVDGGKLAANAIIVCEHAKEIDLPNNYGIFTLARQETYGGTIISIYRK